MKLANNIVRIWEVTAKAAYRPRCSSPNIPGNPTPYFEWL